MLLPAIEHDGRFHPLHDGTAIEVLRNNRLQMPHITHNDIDNKSARPDTRNTRELP